HEGGGPARGLHHLHVPPADAGRRTERLHQGLLGGEARRVGRCRVAAPLAGGGLGLGVDALAEPLSIRPGQDPSDALHGAEVHAEPHDGHPHGLRISATMSRTARSIPTRTARAMMACPMFSSSISSMRAIAWTLS